MYQLQKTKTWRRARTSIVILALVAVSVAFGLGRLGHWLVVADPLEHARAIVVLSGRVPFRAMEAALIYHQGWAQEVWLTRAVQPAEETALARLGIRVGRGEMNQGVLERVGVPSDAIRILDKGIRNTEEELQVIARELQTLSARKVILVTSKPHTRMVRATWRAVTGDLAAMVRYICKRGSLQPKSLVAPYARRTGRVAGDIRLV